MEWLRAVLWAVRRSHCLHVCSGGVAAGCISQIQNVRDFGCVRGKGICVIASNVRENKIFRSKNGSVFT